MCAFSDMNMKIKVSFWGDEQSYKILDKISKHTYKSDSDDLLSNTEKSESEYFPETESETESESIISEQKNSDSDSDSDTAKLFPPSKKLHPKLYQKKKIILTKINKNNDEDGENDSEDDDKIYDGDDENDDDNIYKLSSPLYDSDSNDRLHRLTLLYEIKKQNNDQNDLTNDENFFDQITVDEIRSHFNNTSDDEIDGN